MAAKISMRRMWAVAAFLAATPALAGCSTATPEKASATPTAAVPSDLGVNSFSAGFTYMARLRPLTAQGSGMVGVILGDSSAQSRFKDFEAQLQSAFEQAGYSSSQIKIDDARGGDESQLSLAQEDIGQGASVLVVDPLSDAVGADVARYAQDHGVKVITFDHPIFSGGNTYHVDFDSVRSGTLLGQGFMQCVLDWKVSNPKVFVLNGGEDTDPNAIAVAQGYNRVLWGDGTTPQRPGKTNNQGFVLIADQIAKGWDTTEGTSVFQEQYKAHKEINATLEASDELGNAVIQVLKKAGVKPRTVPATGQDATLQGMVNVVQGYQCGSVYKPPYLEAQAAVALATVLRAGATPPRSLVNATLTPPAGVSGRQQQAVLLAPTWVTLANLARTVLKDGFVSASALCSVVGAAVCQANNIPTS
jgi:D-xylose transport system substrate-binding protein